MFSIPTGVIIGAVILVAILTSTYTDALKIKYGSTNKGNNDAEIQNLRQSIENMTKEYKDFERRLANIETIVGEEIKLENSDKSVIDIRAQLEKMRKEIEILKQK